MENDEQKNLFYRWFIWAISISFGLFALYIKLHICIQGHEIKKLSAEQLSTLNNLITSTASKDDKEKKEEIRSFLKSSLLQDFNKTPLDTKTRTSTDTNEEDSTQTDTTNKAKSDTIKICSNEDAKKIDNFVDAHTLPSILILLPVTNFDVPSFFWMKGSKVYLELLFWIWFGVISSVLYRVVHEYNKDCFSGKLIYAHIAKLIYAPFVGIVLYQCSDLLASQKLIALDKISNASIVFVFILGFFSGRAIELLNKIKDVIIPSTDSDEEDIENAQKFEVQGTVKKDPTVTTDLATCEVKLKNIKKPTVEFSTNAASDGTFKFQNVPIGSYQLSAEMKNGGTALKASQEIVIDKTKSSPISNITLLLKV